MQSQWSRAFTQRIFCGTRKSYEASESKKIQTSFFWSNTKSQEQRQQSWTLEDPLPQNCSKLILLKLPSQAPSTPLPFLFIAINLDNTTNYAKAKPWKNQSHHHRCHHHFFLQPNWNSHTLISSPIFINFPFTKQEKQNSKPLSQTLSVFEKTLMPQTMIAQLLY